MERQFAAYPRLGVRDEKFEVNVVYWAGFEETVRGADPIPSVSSGRVGGGNADIDREKNSLGASCADKFGW